MGRLLRLVAVLSRAPASGVGADALLVACRYGAASREGQLRQLRRDLRHMHDLGWEVENVAPRGTVGRYRFRPGMGQARPAARGRPPAYAQRLTRLPRVLDLLGRVPEGLTLDDLARGVGVPVDTLREDLLVFYTLDLPGSGVTTEVIEFVDGDGEPTDPRTAPRLRLTHGGPLGPGALGVGYGAAPG